jgi:hypothetical protein
LGVVGEGEQGENENGVVLFLFRRISIHHPAEVAGSPSPRKHGNLQRLLAICCSLCTIVDRYQIFKNVQGVVTHKQIHRPPTTVATKFYHNILITRDAPIFKSEKQKHIGLTLHLGTKQVASYEFLSHRL